MISPERPQRSIVRFLQKLNTRKAFLGILIFLALLDGVLFVFQGGFEEEDPTKLSTFTVTNDPQQEQERGAVLVGAGDIADCTNSEGPNK